MIGFEAGTGAQARVGAVALVTPAHQISVKSRGGWGGFQSVTMTVGSSFAGSSKRSAG